MHLLLGRQKLCFITMNVMYGSPNNVMLCFVGSQLPYVENHYCIGSCDTDNENHKFLKNNKATVVKKFYENYLHLKVGKRSS